jgi:hypothetical protein
MQSTMSMAKEKNLQPKVCFTSCMFSCISFKRQTCKGLDCVQFMASPGSAIFFVVFIAVCSFCLVQLYVGVIFFQFSRIRAFTERGIRNTEDEQLQQQWIELARLVFRTSPREVPPQQTMRLRAAARTLSLSKRFDAAIMLIVSGNIVCMAVTTYNQGTVKTRVLERLNLVRFAASVMSFCCVCTPPVPDPALRL